MSIETLIDDLGGVTVNCERGFTSSEGYKFKKIWI